MGLIDGKQIKDASIPNSKLTGPVGLTPTAVKTGSYNAVIGDFIPCDTTSAGFTVTLPSAPTGGDGKWIAVKMIIQGGSNLVTITCGGTDVFNKAGGVTSATVTLLGQALWFQYKSSTGIWYVLADDLPLAVLDLRFANLVSPALTGSPTVPTLSSSDNSTKIANTATVQSIVGAGVSAGSKLYMFNNFT